jgi:GNAT superfamily N-acetyltransferase
MNVRRIRADDTIPFRELRLRALRSDPDAFASSYEREVDRPIETWETWAALSSEGPDQVMFLAESDDELVGLAGAFREQNNNPRAMHLIAMWVDPEHRRTGVGKALTREIVLWARRSDADEVFLWVVGDNDGARLLYEEAGFEATGESMPLPSNPDLTEYRMVRLLETRFRMPDGYTDLEAMDAADRRAFIEWVIADRTARLMEEEELPLAEASQRVRARIGLTIDAPPGTSHHFARITMGVRSDTVGWMWMIERRRDGYRYMVIEEVVIFDEFRGRGLAPSAVDSAILETEFKGIKVVEASIPLDHLVALRIAEGCGFVEVGRTDSEILMRLDIVPGPR